ncbi:type II toxin-antitoxin system VapC family toxin [Dyadobacter psychrotolerans]|uniref:Type II toxin-antitoxin system VapC family toxin n=1 Tax=Dyadobacter psychrotolerans TaxID=2541721 RepID=A0A4R5DM33_9BACT|nr:type II toxin-antitoxin system VapC family toxin [Dyadobacter psychrotolerans]TDE14527.1 type II toxin-antitoxin system VapC family toxin [Dyadobacter psychrotolerans]
MKYLLDTHTLVWAMIDRGKLSPKVSGILEEPSNEVLVSTISFWEISLKFSLGKLNLHGVTPDEIPELVGQMQFRIMPLNATESSTYHNLKTLHHRDPFDRMLIWQAIQSNLGFISNDNKMQEYQPQGLRLIW